MDWKSKINSVGFVFLIVMIAGVSALTVGGILTQQQLDGIDVQATDLEPEVVSKEKNSKQIRVWFSYLTLEDLENGTYEVQRKTNVVVYSLSTYNACRESGSNKADCIALGKSSMIAQAKSLIRGEKSYLEELQGQDYSDEISVDDFAITDNDLG